MSRTGPGAQASPVAKDEMSQPEQPEDSLPPIARGLLIGPNGHKQSVIDTDTTPALFSRDGARRFLYLFAEQSGQARKQYFYVGQEGRPEPFANVLPATASVLRQRGVWQRFALLEVEVNGGKGSPPLPLGENFIASKIRVLDKTSEYPFDSSAAIDEAVERCRSKFSTLRTTPAFDSALRLVFRDDKNASKKENLLINATWLSEAERIRIKCHFRLVNDELKFGRGVLPKEDLTEPPEQGIPFGRQVGIRITLTFEVDKTGQIEFTGETAPHPFNIEIPPPGGTLDLSP
jgi:hypothetical protein